MEVIFVEDCAAIVNLDIDEVGIDAVDSRAEGPEEHGSEEWSECSRGEGSMICARRYRVWSSGSANSV
jgi:hypothetical protein